MRTVNILGTEYKIECRKISDDTTLKNNGWSGYRDMDNKLIVYADTSETEYFPDFDDSSKELYTKRTIKHEIVHAYLAESGLDSSTLNYSCGWAINEEMVDWIAIQSPKIFKTFQELGIL